MCVREEGGGGGDGDIGVKDEQMRPKEGGVT